MLDAHRVEQMFSVAGGVASILPGLRRHRSVVNERGEILALLPSGIDPEDRADILAAILLRHASARIDPRDMLALLARAFRPLPALPAHCTPASVARWLPEEAR